MTETPNHHPHAGSEGPADQPAYQQPADQQPADQQPAYQQPYAYPVAPGELTQTDRNWASASHWGTLVAAWLAMGFIAPLVIMLTVGNQSAFVRRHAVESLNFQLSVLIYGVAAFLFSLVTIGLGLLIVIPLALVFLVFALVFLIQGSIKAMNGEEYRYPLTLRLVH